MSFRDWSAQATATTFSSLMATVGSSTYKNCDSFIRHGPWYAAPDATLILSSHATPEGCGSREAGAALKAAAHDARKIALKQPVRLSSAAARRAKRDSGAARGTTIAARGRWPSRLRCRRRQPWRAGVGRAGNRRAARHAAVLITWRVRNATEGLRASDLLPRRCPDRRLMLGKWRALQDSNLRPTD
jgi:hypothetical protein